MSEKLKNFTQSLPGQHSELLVTCGSAVAQSVPGPLSPLQRTAVDCDKKIFNMIDVAKMFSMSLI